jgi:hypothetical protein
MGIVFSIYSSLWKRYHNGESAPHILFSMDLEDLDSRMLCDVLRKKGNCSLSLSICLYGIDTTFGIGHSIYWSLWNIHHNSDTYRSSTGPWGPFVGNSCMSHVYFINISNASFQYSMHCSKLQPKRLFQE